MDSIWNRQITLPYFSPIHGDMQTDVLIIGGGMTGLLCAHYLRSHGIKCIIAEANTIMNGTSGRTTAKITAQHGLIYAKLTQTYGAETAAKYYRANMAALNAYRKLSEEIPCEFEEQDAYLYSEDDPESLKEEYCAIRAFGGETEYLDAVPLPFQSGVSIRMPHQAQFHPLKFASELIRDLEIYEHTRVLKLHGTTAVTKYGKIKAGHVIVATHYPFLRFRGAYPIKLYQQRSYVLALEGASIPPGMYLGTDPDGLSFRRSGPYVLLGGNSHRTGTGTDGWKQLREAASAYFPGAKEAAAWATQDCMSLDGIPYIGAYGKNTFVATGYNKWGMTSSMVAANLLSDAIRGYDNPWKDVFNPARTVLHPQLAVNAAESAKNLLTPSVKRCPHLGCALKWNEAEHTWDCPCHGSRFGEDGHLINDPAQHGLK